MIENDTRLFLSYCGRFFLFFIHDYFPSLFDQIQKEYFRDRRVNKTDITFSLLRNPLFSFVFVISEEIS